jgi:predicted amidophosphoribosyltransferase
MMRIATSIACSRHLPIAQPLERISTVVQHGANRQVRIRQAKDMFATRESVAGSPLLLLDDIYTTGSTVASAAAHLRSMTDKPIYLAVIARQPTDDQDEW